MHFTPPFFLPIAAALLAASALVSARPVLNNNPLSARDTNIPPYEPAPPPYEPSPQATSGAYYPPKPKRDAEAVSEPEPALQATSGAYYPPKRDAVSEPAIQAISGAYYPDKA